MPAKDYGFWLSAVDKTDAQPSIVPGGSGYFSSPRTDLDPRLFEGDHLIPAVREWVMNTLYNYWSQHFHGPRAWSTVWAAGSGISYQWKSDRSNGDLDILIGVDFPHFYKVNPDFSGTPEEEMADIFNRSFHQDLWPKTSDWHGFEVTFYVNPNSADIRNINPYAAYDLTHDRWTTRPPVLPNDPSTLYPASFKKAVGAEQEQARGIVARYGTLKNQVDATQPGSPGWHNAVAALNGTVSQGRALFDSIHLGRKMAFGEGGSGYGDYYNYRWQAHKAAGTAQALAALSQIDKDAHLAQQTDLYGQPLRGASQTLSEASMVHSGGNR
jgi:hypothetical protein